MHRLDEPLTYKYAVYQTMKCSFEQISQGQDPWIPLGKFMNHWYEGHADERERLIADPLTENYPRKYHRWAVFCAASVEWFSHKYGVLCPEWVHNSRYILAEPWVFHEYNRDALVKTTPQEFTSRNIFCGDTIYANKWEFAEEVQQRYSHILAERRAAAQRN